MKLFLIYRGANKGYDTYDSAVVVAENSNDAQKMFPRDVKGKESDRRRDSRAEPYDVNVVCLGEASRNFKEQEVICALVRVDW